MTRNMIMSMWNTPNSNLKRRQSDTDEDTQRVFLEKRLQKRRKKRKKTRDNVGIIDNLRNMRNGLSSLPGVTRSRLSQKLGTLSNGKQATAPAIREIQNKLDNDIVMREPDLNQIRGPPTYRNLPKPTIFHDNNSKHHVTAHSTNHRQSSQASSIDADMFVMVDTLLAKHLTEAWPHVTYEEELQLQLNSLLQKRVQTEEEMKLAKHNNTPMTNSNIVLHGSGASSTNLSMPFSSWSIHEDSDAEMENRFEQSFCQTVKRSFFNTAAQQWSDHGTEDLNALSLFDHNSSADFNVSASGLTVLENQAKSECFQGGYRYGKENFKPLSQYHNLNCSAYGSGRASCPDFLDTIHDTYHLNPASVRAGDAYGSRDSGIYDPYNYVHNPELSVRGVKKDFIDVVDSMYNVFDENSNPTINAAVNSSASSGKTKRLRRINDAYKQFYLRKEWLK